MLLFSYACSPIPSGQGSHKEPGDTYIDKGLCYSRGILILRNPHLFAMGNMHIYPLLQREIFSLLHRTIKKHARAILWMETFPPFSNMTNKTTFYSCRRCHLLLKSVGFKNLWQDNLEGRQSFYMRFCFGVKTPQIHRKLSLHIF